LVEYFENLAITWFSYLTTYIDYLYIRLYIDNLYMSRVSNMVIS